MEDLNTQEEFERTIIEEDIEFVYVCNAKDIKEGKSKRIAFQEDVDMQYAVFRIKGDLYCVSNICPHRHATKIFEGIIKGLTVTCPLHGWTYSLSTGENINQKQGIRKLDTFKIIEKNGRVYMEKPEIKIPKWRKGTNIDSGMNPVFD